MWKVFMYRNFSFPFLHWMMSWQHFIASRALSDGALATQVGGFGRDGEGAGATGKISLRYEGINSPALPAIVNIWKLGYNYTKR